MLMKHVHIILTIHFRYNEINLLFSINFVTSINLNIRIVFINHNNHSNDSFMMSHIMIKIKIKTSSIKINHSRLTFKQIVLRNSKIKIAFKTIKTIKINKTSTIFFDHFFVSLIILIIRIAL